MPHTSCSTTVRILINISLYFRKNDAFFLVDSSSIIAVMQDAVYLISVAAGVKMQVEFDFSILYWSYTCYIIILYYFELSYAPIVTLPAVGLSKAP